MLQAFHREARNEFNQLRFIPAFINFFYVLEALFSNGQSKKNLMVREFEKSASLRNFAERLLASSAMNSGEHHINLSAMLKHRQKNWDADGLFYLIAEIRGELHHYAATMRKGYGTPFRNNEYYTVALAVMYLSTAAITEELHKLTSSAKAKRAPASPADDGA